MAFAQSQISAYISPNTRQMVDQYARANGVKKGFLIESALLHHLQALQELPADIIIPPEIVVTLESGKFILDQLENRPEPNEAMMALFDNNILADMVIDND